MANKDYLELLKDPRWQKKRLEIFELDHWTCRRCHNKEKTLNVHHIQYEKGKLPWEYENDRLITLCEICHKQAHDIDWQQAFLNLNTSPQELLDIALSFQHYTNICDKQTLEIQKKYKTRYHFENHSLIIHFSPGDTHGEGMDALDAFYKYYKKNRPKYGGI